MQGKDLQTIMPSKTETIEREHCSPQPLIRMCHCSMHSSDETFEEDKCCNICHGCRNLSSYNPAWHQHQPHPCCPRGVHKAGRATRCWSWGLQGSHGHTLPNKGSIMAPGMDWGVHQRHRSSVKALALPQGPWHTPPRMHSPVFFSSCVRPPVLGVCICTFRRLPF